MTDQQRQRLQVAIDYCNKMDYHTNHAEEKMQLAHMFLQFTEHLLSSGKVIDADKIKYDTQIVDKIMEIDWQGTKEFCEKNNYPVPYYTGDVQSSAQLFIGVDAKKWHVLMEYAKSVRRGQVVPETTIKTFYECRQEILKTHNWVSDTEFHGTRLEFIEISDAAAEMYANQFKTNL